MFSPLLSIITAYGGPLVAGVLTGLFCKAFFASKMKGKIKDYQIDIVKNHAKILELEALNARLEKRLTVAEGVFTKDMLFMN